MTRSALLTVLFIPLCISCFAQPSWQWGKRGGSYTASGAGGTDETVVDMATDANGNIYVLSNVWSPGLDINGLAKTGYGGSDIMLSSFKCDGTYRWSKLVGGIHNDKSVAVKTDTINGVYITGYLQGFSGALHLDADSVWSGGSNKTLFLAKYDTSGTYKWFRMPQADSVSGYSSSNSATYDLDVDAGGDIYWFCNLAPGAYISGSYIVPTNTIHLLKYNSNGIFQSGVQMQLSYSGGPTPYFRMARNHENGKMCVTGTPPTFCTITFGTTIITHTLYLGCFNNTGASLWTLQNMDNASNGPLGRPAIDNSGNIYFSGQIVDADNFNSFVVNNPWGPAGTIFLEKVDSAGAYIWGTNALSTDEIESGAIVLDGNDVVVAGSYPGALKWGGDSILHLPSCGYSPFIARFNALTGAFIHIDTLASGCGNDAHPSCMVSDGRGNVYTGGFLGSTITVNGMTLTSSGGGTDFFLAKYGSALCDCVPPVANFSSTGTYTMNFVYTGTPIYDSVRWNFGDGGTSSLASPAHIFTTSGSYTVCVTVYTPCGSNTHCQTVTITAGTGGVASSGFENVNIYPNPVQELLTIDNLTAGTMVSLYNILGVEVYSDKVTASRITVNMQQLPSGVYAIQLTDNEGHRAFKTIVKK